MLVFNVHHKFLRALLQRFGESLQVLNRNNSPQSYRHIKQVRLNRLLVKSLTLRLEVIDVEVGDDEVAVLLDGVFVPFLEAARKHYDDFLIGCSHTTVRIKIK